MSVSGFVVTCPKAGQLLGVVVTPDRQLHVYIDGELKAKCGGLNLPGQVYGVIDLYGCAEQVSIVGERWGRYLWIHWGEMV